MDCREVQQLMSEFVDGSLPESLSRQVERHIEQCEACRDEWSIWRESNRLLFSSIELKEEELQRVSIVDDVMQRILEEEKVGSFSKKISRPPLAASSRIAFVAAGLFLFVFATFFYLSVSAADPSLSLIDLGKGWESVGKISTVYSFETAVGGEMTDLPGMHGKGAVASIGDPVFYMLRDEREPARNQRAFLSFFGLLMVVLGTTWLSIKIEASQKPS
ncbi:hypothetical protein BSNK01_13700 [Bacillaceae bacterium]